jgi:phage/plasmid primase-like uncharacterized protein
MNTFIDQHDVIEQFKQDAFNRVGLDLSSVDIIADGQLHNVFKANGGKSGEKIGAYTLHLDSRPAGYFQLMSGGDGVNWSYNDPDYKPPVLTPEQRKQQAEQQRQSKDLREKELADKYAAAAKKAAFIWKQSTPLTDNESHEYLVKKGIKGVYSIRVNHYQGNTSLVIPVGKDGAFSTLQFISPDGSKRFLPDGKKSGCYSILNKMEHPRYIAVGEGFATVASILDDKFSQEKGVMGVMALDAGNLEAVAVAMREQFPTIDILIFGDIGDTDSKGEKSARAAAKLVNGYCVLPPMAKGDFNDYLTGGNVTTSLDDLIMAAANETQTDHETPLNFAGHTVTNSTLEPTPPTHAKIKELNDNEAALLNGVYDKAKQPTMATVTQLVTKPKADNSTFKTISLRDLLNRKYVTNWLVKGVIEQGNLALFFGDSASGKTFYIMDMCFCIAAGIDFKGKATKQGNVLYICGEGFSGLQKRFMALYQHYGVMPENLHLSEQPAAFMDISSAAAVMDTINQIGNVSLIVIDTFHRNMGGGSEDSAADISQFLGNIDTFLKPTGAAVAIIHHSGHGEKGRSRGSSSIKAAMDVEYQVAKDSLTNMVTVTNTKMKDWQAPPPACFNMNVVNLFDDHNQPISDEDGELLTSVILEPTDYIPSKGGVLNGRQQDVLAELHKAIEQHGITPTDDIRALFPDSPQNIPAMVVHSDKWRELAMKVIYVEAEPEKEKGAMRKAFFDCKKTLMNSNKIGYHDNFYWINS